jgi:hypothetical protein
MTDTYAKLLGLSGSSTPPTGAGQVEPTQSPTHPEKKTGVLAKKQTSKPVKKPPFTNVTRHASQAVPSPLSPLRQSPAPLDTSLLTTKEKTKYGTYLTDESIQKLRIRAAQTNRDDHQVLQEAVNQYFDSLES